MNLSGADLSDSDFRVLEVLLHKGPLPVNTIDPKVWLAPGSISVAVDRLEKKALVKRNSTDDRRVRLVELTAKGRVLITQTFQEHAAAMGEAASVLSKEERLRRSGNDSYLVSKYLDRLILDLIQLSAALLPSASVNRCALSSPVLRH